MADRNCYLHVYLTDSWIVHILFIFHNVSPTVCLIIALCAEDTALLLLEANSALGHYVPLVPH